MDRNRMSLGAKIVIVIFCVILVLTLLLPSLSVFFENKGNKQEEVEEPKQTQTTTIADVEAQYEPIISSINERLDDDPENVALLTSLGDAYFDKGITLMNIQATDTDSEYSSEAVQPDVIAFNKAIEIYDKVLEQSSSDTVTLSRANALYYSGKQDEAISYLEEFISNGTDYAPIYSNLGLFYENSGNYEEANKWYDKALENDPDNKYGIKEFVEIRRSVMDNQELDSSGSKDQDDGQTEDSNETTTE